MKVGSSYAVRRTSSGNSSAQTIPSMTLHSQGKDFRNRRNHCKDQLKHSTLFAMAKAYRPAVVYILLGGNDLDSHTSAEET